MNTWIVYSISVFLLISLELLYFRIAERFQIIDQPNQRSSHTLPTIRGAGIIFPVAVLIWFGFDRSLPYFVGGMVLISVVSFADDLKPVSSGLRAALHMIAMVLLFYQLSLFNWPVWLIASAFIVAVGALSAFNFMDGINGITGLYALANLVTFLLIDQWIISFTDIHLLVIATLAVLLFLYFNLRVKARCFAGDVGSVSLAFLQIFLMFQLIKATDSLMWVSICVVFGVDSVLTILYRIRQRENIFLPHRQHVFQYLSNELKWSHRQVSLLYAGVQFMINLLLIAAYTCQFYWVSAVLIAIYFIAFFFVRLAVLKQVRAKVSL